MQDNFKDKADNWDKGATRVGGAKCIADSLQKRISLESTMNIIDFGVGTGLLGFEILKKVNTVLGVDISKAMIEKVHEKNTPEVFIKTLQKDILLYPLQKTYDGLVSSMTLHHIENLILFFKTIYSNLNNGGFIAIADLESEDGTFHSNNEGVFHYGFDEKELCKIVTQAGFKNIVFENINTIHKPQKNYGVFLLTATK